MPNRIIKESICCSDNLDNLTGEEESFFFRILVNCDDYGRFDARPIILLARCFPLRVGKLTELQVLSWLKSLVDHQLVRVYTIDGRHYLQVTTWDKHQQIRAKRSKYPNPNGNPQSDSIFQQLNANDSILHSAPTQAQNNDVCQQVIADDNKCPRNPIQSNPIQSIINDDKKNDGTDELEDLINIGGQSKKQPSEWITWRKHIFSELKRRRNYNLTPGQRNGEAKTMTWLFQQGYTPDLILKAYDLLKAQKFWADKTLTIPSLANQIGEILNYKSANMSKVSKYKHMVKSGDAD